MTRSRIKRPNCGRPRKLNDAQVAQVIEWRRNRKTRRELARELGISETTLQNTLDRFSAQTQT